MGNYIKPRIDVKDITVEYGKGKNYDLTVIEVETSGGFLSSEQASYLKDNFVSMFSTPARKRRGCVLDILRLKNAGASVMSAALVFQRHAKNADYDTAILSKGEIRDLIGTVQIDTVVNVFGSYTEMYGYLKDHDSI